MSQIDRLAIRGIRSFDPKEVNTIEFYSPLTLILGHNGAGKTTVIECLKYATTGDLPPNSKNGAFIHDPRLANETEVKAQIKLRFKNVNGKEMVCTRSMSLTCKKNALSMKTLESLLVTKNELDEKVSISSKCAELDVAIPEQLGVSKAILENVIFCHQEESFWPLSEPANLKKKFDDIFASTRYTKALENMKALRKDKQAQIKVDENELSHLKADKERADQVNRDIKEVEAKIGEATRRKTELESGEISTVMGQLRGLEKEQQEIQKLDAEIRQQEMKRDLVQVVIQELEGSIAIMHESDDVLANMLAQRQILVKKEQDELNTLEARSERVGFDLSVSDSQMGALLTSVGQLQAEQESFERQCSDRDQMMQDIARTCGYRGFQEGSALSDETVRRFSSLLEKDLNSAEVQLEQTKARLQMEEKQIMDRLQKAQSNVSSKEESRKNFKRQIESNRTKVMEFNRSIQSSQVDSISIDDQKAKVSEEEQWLETSRRVFLPADAEAKIKAKNHELQAAEMALDSLGEEMSKISLNAEARAKLVLKLTEKKRKEDSFKNGFENFSISFEKTLNKPPLIDSMVGIIHLELRNKESSLQSCSSNLEEKKLLLSSLDAKISMSKTALYNKTKESEAKIKQIEAVCKFSEFEAAMKEVDEIYAKDSNTFETIESAVQMFKKFLKIFEKERCCPLCHRGFSDLQDEDKFKNKLQSSIDYKIPNVSQLKEELEEKKNTRNLFQDLNAVWLDAIRLKDEEIPELRGKISGFEKERDEVSGQIDDYEMDLVALKAEVAHMSELKSRADDLIRQSQEISMLNSEIRPLESEMSFSGNVRTVQEVQKDLDEGQLKMKTLRRELEKLTSDLRSKQREIQMHENHLLEAKNLLQQYNFKLQERERLQATVVELRNEEEKIKRDIEVTDSVITEMQGIVREIMEELEKHRTESVEVEKKAYKIVEQYRAHSQRFSSLQKNISRYLDDGGPKKVGEASKSLETLREKSRGLQREAKEVAERIAAIQKSHSEALVLQRQMSDNLKLRENKCTLVEVQRGIARIKGELAKKDTSSISAQRRRLTTKYEGYCDELASLNGELKQMEEQQRRLQRDLIKDYKDIDERHKLQVIKLKTEILANQDLEKYSKALENAIMKYHSMKMDEINKIIRELWVNTYKGNDIETIEVRSDNEGTTRAGRSYNYRVVMIKDNAELDMRGRCSAGQKVLTSLIIRLALAETFCLNCGILALDEPTTSLDSENIESLAESLVEIIKMRRAQKNFQLIIITHDENFMNLLGQTEFADYYWRVSKDRNQHSVIERQKISG